MEVTLLTPNCLKIKGKKASLIIDPTNSLKTKTQADAVVVLSAHNTLETGKIEDFRLIIKGPGEYEIGGIKISGIQNQQELVYRILIDNTTILIAQTEGLDKIVDKIGGSDISILKVNGKIDLSLLTSLEERLAILYGQTDESQVGLDKETITKTNKVVTAKEKLPEQMEVVLLSA